jgi:hypothetical protein
LPESTIQPTEASRTESPRRVAESKSSLPQSPAYRAAQGNTPEAELLKALDRTESTPGWNFVSLKKFRDEILPAENIPSIRTDAERQSVIRSAIEKRLILTKPIPNPKSPQFPVTSIRVNRLLPEVQLILGTAKVDMDFHPIHIKGEPLSATILRERR